MIKDAIIITIGSEILTGYLLDTNSAYISKALTNYGINVKKIVSISDDEKDIEKAVKSCLYEAELIITTGGLGSTVDDITKKVVCKIAGSNLVLNEKILKHIKNLFAIRGIEMPLENQVQAMIPETAEIIENEIGLAPGFIIPKEHKKIICFPGVPKEMKPMLSKALEVLYPKKEGIIEEKILRTTGAPESFIDEKISDLMSKYKNPKIGLLAHPSEITIRITGFGEDKENVKRLIQTAGNEIRERLGDLIYGEDNERLEDVAALLLFLKKMTISTAESCTGGLLSERLTNVPGSSTYFMGGMTAYSNESKIKLLKIKEYDINIHGAVSSEVALSMAENVKKAFKTDIGIGITGLAGPSGGTDAKPVGLVYIALAHGKRSFFTQNNFTGGREEIREKTSSKALDILRKYLIGIE